MGIGFGLAHQKKYYSYLTITLILKSIRTGIEPLFGSQNCKGRIEFAIRALQEG